MLIAETRRSPRNKICWPVCIWFPDFNRFVIGNCVDINATGSLIYISFGSKIRVGQVVEVNFPRTEELAKGHGGQFGRLKKARVVRACMKPLGGGLTGIGLEFE